MDGLPAFDVMMQGRKHLHADTNWAIGTKGLCTEILCIPLVRVGASLIMLDVGMTQ